MGLVNTFEGLVAMRVLLGFFEAGLFPGMLLSHILGLCTHFPQAVFTSSACTTNATNCNGV
jgi:hypothetical protein